MVSKYFTVRLICKTKFPDTCHALKNDSAVKGLKFVSTKRDNYLLTLNCTEAHLQCILRQISFNFLADF